MARTALVIGLGGLCSSRASAYKFSMNVEEAIIDLVPAIETVACMAVALVVCIGSIWAWSLYLETRPSFEQMRSYMLAILGAVSACELLLSLLGDVQWWLLPCVLLANSWGLLDAVLRFPAAHDLDSLFAVKQMALLVGKVGAYALAFEHVHENKAEIFASMLVNIIGMPLIYFLALPLEEDEAVAPAGRVVDVDITVRLLQIISNTQERQEFVLGCRRRSRAFLALVARTSPCTAEVLMRTDPSMKKVVWKGSDS